MGPESHLREKLRKIEALFAGAGTLGDVIRKIFGVHQPVPDTHYLIPDLAPSHHESQWHNKLSARQLRLKSSLGMTPVYAFQ